MGVLRIPINASDLVIHESAFIPSACVIFKSSIIVLQPHREENLNAAPLESEGIIKYNFTFPFCPGAEAKIYRP